MTIKTVRFVVVFAIIKQIPLRKQTYRVGNFLFFLCFTSSMSFTVPYTEDERLSTHVQYLHNKIKVGRYVRVTRCHSGSSYSRGTSVIKVVLLFLGHNWLKNETWNLNEKTQHSLRAKTTATNEFYQDKLFTVAESIWNILHSYLKKWANVFEVNNVLKF